MTNSVAEIAENEALFVIGSNTTENHPIIALRMKEAVANGAQLIVADPREDSSGEICHPLAAPSSGYRFYSAEFDHECYS